MARKKTILFFIVSFLFIADGRAQVWEVGAQVGGAGYIGDLNPDHPLKISGLAASLFVKANLDPNWAIGFHYNFGKIKADDAKSTYPQFRDRNLNFYSNLNEFTFMVDFNFLDYFAGGGFKRFSPYLYTGIGTVIFNPKTKYMGKEYELALYTTEGQEKSYKTYALVIPYGAGVKYNFSEKWSLLGNIGYRNAYTDYLDDVSGSYPDPADFANNGSVGQIQKALSDRSGEKTGVYIGAKDTQRGDFRKRDTYMFVGIGITYTFVSQKCF
ncbi:DUF6089 family protein [Pedobacter sp. ASV28]|uniref:type IX secretion system protein PorG n=1 Tax=Pedobacter sp. ASV28 TaxID=2795123 RepID=UPI0018EB4884|nr:DUF6089 family protein [Pedobacter sp. ASV28]